MASLSIRLAHSCNITSGRMSGKLVAKAGHAAGEQRAKVASQTPQVVALARCLLSPELLKQSAVKKARGNAPLPGIQSRDGCT